jgi:catechol 2,3-dioxygenase-like lactoylglutathione lyase family enzyme
MHQFFIRIQQIGIGVCDAETAKHTYKHLFGMDFNFDDEAKASLMTQYTGGQE